MSGQLEITNPDTIAPPKSTYSHVSSFSVTSPCRIISIAGQAGIDKSYELVALDLDSQVKPALENLRACLESVGAGPKDVIRVTHYIVGYDEKTGRGQGNLWISFWEIRLQQRLCQVSPPSQLLSFICARVLS